MTKEQITTSFTDTLCNDMRDLYLLLYTGSTEQKYLESIALTREKPVADYRHIVRYMISRNRPGATYEAIAGAEARLMKKAAPHHTTIINSIRVVNDVLSHQPAYRKLMARIDLYYDRKHNGGGGASWDSSFAKFMGLEKHTLAIVLASVAERNLVGRSLLYSLADEFSGMSLEEIKKTINTKTPEK